jgi:hypothetical protein
MKHIEFVKTIALENVNGDPLVDEKGATQTCSPLEFFRGRIADPAFVEGMDSGDGVDLQFETRRSLRLQEKEAEARGYWELEDEQAKRLKAATDKGAYHKALAFNLVPFIRAVRAMTTPAPAAS